MNSVFSDPLEFHNAVKSGKTLKIELQGSEIISILRFSFFDTYWIQTNRQTDRTSDKL